MVEAKSGATDLFGDPIRLPREGPGRPAHEWTQENSNKINLLFATGSEPRDAAKAIGISYPTFRKVYFSELELWRVAKLRFKASLLAKLFDEGQKGNVGAIKELFRQAEKGDTDAIARALSGARPTRREPKAPKPEPLGKKRELEESAGKVTGVFAPPPPPRVTH